MAKVYPELLYEYLVSENPWRDNLIFTQPAATVIETVTQRVPSLFMSLDGAWVNVDEYSGVSDKFEVDAARFTEMRWANFGALSQSYRFSERARGSNREVALMRDQSGRLIAAEERRAILSLEKGCNLLIAARRLYVQGYDAPIDCGSTAEIRNGVYLMNISSDEHQYTSGTILTPWSLQPVNYGLGFEEVDFLKSEFAALGQDDISLQAHVSNAQRVN